MRAVHGNALPASASLIHRVPIIRIRVAGLLLGGYAATIGVRIDIVGVPFPTVLYLAAVVFVVFAFGVARLPRLRITPIDLIAALYFTARIVLEQISAMNLSHPANTQGVTSTVYYFGAYLCARLVVQDLASARAFLGALVIPSLAVSVLGVAQVAGITVVTNWLLSNTNSDGALSRLEDGRLTRATSLIGHWSALGGYLACVVAICGAALVIDRTSGRLSKIMLVTLVSALVGMVATFTFAVILIGGAVAIVVAAALGYRVRGLIGLSALGVVAWWFFGDSLEARLDLQSTSTNYLPAEYSWLPATLSVRIHYWTTEGIPAFLQQPIWGWGHSVYSSWGGWPIRPTTLGWPYPESEFVKSLVTGGVVEFGLLIALLSSWGTVIRRSAARLGQASSILWALWIGLVAGSVINPYFTNPGLSGLWWPMIGALMWTQYGALANSEVGRSNIPNDEVAASALGDTRTVHLRRYPARGATE